MLPYVNDTQLYLSIRANHASAMEQMTDSYRRLEFDVQSLLSYLKFSIRSQPKQVMILLEALCLPAVVPGGFGYEIYSFGVTPISACPH